MNTPNILPEDTLSTGYPKINKAISNANLALENANESLERANQSLVKSENTQLQVDNLILENGTSDMETVQARGNFPLLYNRLDDVDTSMQNISIDSSKFGSIQEAIDYCVEGQTLLIPKGEYSESFVINKKLKVIANGVKTIGDETVPYLVKVTGAGSHIIGLETDGKLPMGTMIGDSSWQVPQSPITTYGVHVLANDVILEDVVSHHSTFPILIGGDSSIEEIINPKLIRCKGYYAGQNTTNASENGDQATGSGISFKGAKGGTKISNLQVINCEAFNNAYSGFELEPNVSIGNLDIIAYNNHDNGYILYNCDGIEVRGKTYGNKGAGGRILASQNCRDYTESYENYSGTNVESSLDETDLGTIGITVIGIKRNNQTEGVKIIRNIGELSDVFIDCTVRDNSTNNILGNSGIIIAGNPKNIRVTGSSKGVSQKYGVEVLGGEITLFNIILAENGSDSYALGNFDYLILKNVIKDNEIVNASYGKTEYQLTDLDFLSNYIISNDYYLWADGNGVWRTKKGKPNSDSDGVKIGTQQ